MLPDEIEREKRMTQVIKHTHKNDEIEPLAELFYLIYRQIGKLDILLANVGRESGLCQVVRVVIHRQDPACPAARHLDRIKAAAAPYVQHRRAGQVGRNSMCESFPLDSRIVTEEMVGGGLYTPQVDVV